MSPLVVFLLTTRQYGGRASGGVRPVKNDRLTTIHFKAISNVVASSWAKKPFKHMTKKETANNKTS